MSTPNPIFREAFTEPDEPILVPSAGARKPRVCTFGRIPTERGPKIHWYEALPGFWLPNALRYDRARWPDYTAIDFQRALAEAPQLDNLLRLRGFGRPDGKLWAIWFAGFGCDRRIGKMAPALQPIADAMYEKARFKHLVPFWRQWMITALTEIDDLEDQISTVLWVIELLAKKVPGLSKINLDAPRALNRLLNDAERALAGATLTRRSKAEWKDKQNQVRARKRAARTKGAKLFAWLQQNYGRLLEAAQATGTWADVGIVLGPIFGFVEEGIWGVVKGTATNYSIAIDALYPGYREFDIQFSRDVDTFVEENLIQPLENFDWSLLSEPLWTEAPQPPPEGFPFL